MAAVNTSFSRYLSLVSTRTSLSSLITSQGLEETPEVPEESLSRWLAGMGMHGPDIVGHIVVRGPYNGGILWSYVEVRCIPEIHSTSSSSESLYQVQAHEVMMKSVSVSGTYCRCEQYSIIHDDTCSLLDP